jgi:ubinuclein
MVIGCLVNRSLLCEVVRIKLQCLELVKPRKESADLNLRNFLETEVKPLWHPGWMKVSTLLRESREAHATAV